MVLDAPLFNTQHYKVQIIGTIYGKELHPPQNLGVVANEKGAIGLLSTMVANFTYIYIHKYILNTNYIKIYIQCPRKWFQPIKKRI